MYILKVQSLEKVKKIISVALFVLTHFTSSVMAKEGDLININIDNGDMFFDVYAVAGDPVDHWNFLQYPNMTAYKNATGNASVALVDAKGGSAGSLITWISAGKTNIDPEENAFYYYNEDDDEEIVYEGYQLMNSYNFADGSPNTPFGQYTINGLSAGTYRLYIYTQGAISDVNNPLTITVNGKPAPSNDAGYHNDLHEFKEGKNYVQTTVTLSSGEDLTFTYTAGVSKIAIVNGFQILGIEDAGPTPEPSSIMLMGVGTIIAFTYYRRRTNESHSVSA